jgi:hypothetical protein
MLLALTASVYLPGLGGPALLDDRTNLAPLAAVADGSITALDYVLGSGQLSAPRPLARASFLLSWWLGGDDLRGFKAANVALHLLCGLAVFALARRLAEAAGMAGAEAVALFVCGAWLLSPMLASTVLYTVQRMAQLAALFSLCGLYAYARARGTGERWPLAAAAACWILGTLGKENAAVLPLLALLVEVWFFSHAPHARLFRNALAALVLSAALLLALRVAIEPQWLLAAYAGRDFDLGARLLTQPRVLFDYLGNLLLAPGASSLGVFRDDVAASSGLFAPATTAWSLLGWLVLGGLALVSRTRAMAAAGFGLLFFLAAHAVESSIFALELYFEHRNYLPAFGVMFALGSLGPVIAARSRRMVLPIAVTWLLTLALLSGFRAWIWRSEGSLYVHATATHPNSARAWLGLASVQFNAGRFDSGLESLDRAADLLGERSRLPIALQVLAARCVSAAPIPESSYAGIERATRVGVDLHTINALAWTAGAIGACTTLDAPRLRAALTSLSRAPAPWSPARERLRDEHLARVLRALAQGPGAGR